MVRPLRVILWVLVACCAPILYSTGPSPTPRASAPSLSMSAAWAGEDGPSGSGGDASPWKTTWHDEFEGPDGSLPDSAKWVLETGGHGWGNNELQTYTARPENMCQQRGSLVIRALREQHTGADGIPRAYTSARMKTLGRFAQQYGRFEARIKVPEGQGLWPAFWMLGDDIASKGWPECGEIDIMENIGREPSKAFGTLHGPGYSGAGGISAALELPGGKRLAEDFHVFAADWDPSAIQFYVDGKMYARRTPADLPRGKRWAFDHPFFMLMNVAVGGGWPGNPNATTVFPQAMYVEYVRVYKRGGAQ